MPLDRHRNAGANEMPPDQLGPLHLPFGTLPPTGKRMDAPCCDVFELADGKIKRFDCYPGGSVVLTQLGVIDDLGAALTH